MIVVCQRSHAPIAPTGTNYKRNIAFAVHENGFVFLSRIELRDNQKADSNLG
jgi:hypothetical protein